MSMTKRHLLAVACLVLSGISTPAAEPFVQGRPLSYWLLLLREGELRVDPAGPWESEVGPAPFRVSQALKSLGPEAQSAVPALLAWFREDNGSEDAHCIKAQYLHAALRDVGCTDPALTPLRRGLAVLVARADSPEAVDELRRQEQQTRAAGLLAEFRSRHDRVRRFGALERLSEIDPAQAQIGLPLLKEALLAPTEPGYSRYGAILDSQPILERMGSAGREAAPLLEYRFRQEGRASFVVTLAHIAPDRVPPLLRRQPAALRKEVIHRLSMSESLQPAVADLFAELVEASGVTQDTATALGKLDPSKAKKTIPLFVKLLDDLDPEMQLRAAAGLLHLDVSRNKEIAVVLRNIIRTYEGPSRDRARELLRLLGREAIAALIDLLDDPRWAFDVLDELPRFGPDAKEAMPALRKILAHKDRAHFVRAAWAMARIDVDSVKHAAPALLEAKDDSSAVVRQLALLSLGNLAGQDEKALMALTGKLGSKVDANDVTIAVHGLLSLGKTAVKPLMVRLADPDVQTRCNAAWMLAEIGPPANAALPELRKLLGDREQIVRVRAIYALARIDPKQDLKEIEDILRAGMERGDSTGREAALVLGRLARERDLMPIILQDLNSWSKKRVVAANAALALSTCGATAAERSPKLLSTIKSTLSPKVVDVRGENEAQRSQAFLRLLLRATMHIGPAALEVAPALLSLGPLAEFRQEADVALRAIGAPGKVRPTNRNLEPDGARLGTIDPLDNAVTPRDAVLAHVRAGRSPPASFLNAYTFGQTPPRDVELVRKADKELIPELVKLLSNEDSPVRQAAAYALGLAGPAAREAAPRLARMLREDGSGIEATITFALWQTRRASGFDSEVFAALEGMLKSRKWYQRAWAIQRLRESGWADRAIPELRKSLDDTISEVCVAAIEAIGAAGASDKETIEKLGKLVGSGDLEVMEAALLLLGKIGVPVQGVVLTEERWLNQILLDERRRFRPNRKELILAAARVDRNTIPHILARLLVRLRREDDGVPEMLALLGPAARSAIPQLMEAYRKSSSYYYRRQILDALSILGPESKQTIPLLARNARSSPDDAALLGAFGKLSKEAVPELLEGLKAKALDFRRADLPREQNWHGEPYVDALGSIGSDARAAVPELLKLHEHWRMEPLIYLRIAAALKKIDADAARKAGIP
jgi:HEAT repeat protein